MVFINDKKYACESCIKGHRSSSCRHNERPLFEIKKKGRPVSQCDRCRELRKTKKVHGKCLCNVEREDSSRPIVALQAPKQPTTKAKRFIPITPALPNGLKDLIPSTVPQSIQVRQQFDSLLNPCLCKDVWSCKCRSVGSSHSGALSHGLATLARAATLCCETDVTPATGPTTPFEILSPSPTVLKKRTHDDRQSPTPTLPVAKRSCCAGKQATPPLPERGPELPPILIDDEDVPNTLPPPNFPPIPPLSAVASLAGSGCTCGFRCACPGCAEHRGPAHTSAEHANCADGACATCVDHQSGIGMALPGQASGGGSEDIFSGSAAASHVLDKFFARAAALPPPPAGRRLGGGLELDPTNVVVYPTDLFGGRAGAVIDEDMGDTKADRLAAFGLGVRLPKLCCGGNCGCPGGRCACGQACDGCCSEHEADAPGSPVAGRVFIAVEIPYPAMRSEETQLPKSCCSA